jgi:hypothetical protein
MVRRCPSGAFRVSGSNSLGADGVLVVEEGIVHNIGAPIATGTKTDETRLVALDGAEPDVVDETPAAREVQLRAAGLPFRDDSYVFTFDLTGTRPRRPDRVSKVWAEIRSELGLSDELEFRSTAIGTSQFFATGSASRLSSSLGESATPSPANRPSR